MKIAVVQMGLEDNDLRRHLLARVDRLTTSLLCARGGQEHHYGLLDRVMKDEFDAEKLGRVGSGQLTDAMSLKRTVHWHEQEMCFSWAGGTRYVTELAVLPGRTDTRAVTKTLAMLWSRLRPFRQPLSWTGPTASTR